MLRGEKRLVRFKSDAEKRSVLPYRTPILPIVKLPEYSDKHFENPLRRPSRRVPVQKILPYAQVGEYHDFIINEYRAEIIPDGGNSSTIS